MARQTGDLAKQQAERRQRAVRSIEALHVRELLVAAILEVECENTRWAVEYREGLSGELEADVPHPVGEPTGAYEMAMELRLRPPVPLGALVQLAVDFDDGSLHVADLVVEGGRCRSMVFSAPLTVTIVHMAREGLHRS